MARSCSAGLQPSRITAGLGSVGFELWVFLVEKAFAKYHGG
jgi:hypothetical protein